MGSSDSLELPRELRELTGLDDDEEAALLDSILEAGWELGTLIVLGPEREPPALSPAAIRELHGALASRGKALYPRKSDPFEANPPAQTDFPDGQGIYVVLNQRCDLIYGIAREPLVVVAPAEPVADQSKAATIANRASATHVWLGRDAEGRTWGADLRAIGNIPKTWLKGSEAYFPLAPGEERRRLARDVGHRFTREAVPTSVVKGFQDPVSGLYKKAEFRKVTELFKELVLLRNGDEFQLLALTDHGEDYDDVNNRFDRMVELIQDAAPDFPLNVDQSAAVRIDELPASDYLVAIRLDMNRVTYGSKSNLEAHAEPGFIVASEGSAN